jgi:hypothetical protein
LFSEKSSTFLENPPKKQPEVFLISSAYIFSKRAVAASGCGVLCSLAILR